jgi:hypothetical protein
MAEPTPPRRSPFAWAVAAVLLLIAVAATLIVPIYARITPKLGAFPFFYWYQLILVPVIAILSWLSYLCVRTRRASGTNEASDTGASS